MLTQAQEMQRRFASLGTEVPLFWITTEQPREIQMWQPDQPIDLRLPPYDLDASFVN